MIKYTLKYTDYDDVEHEEDFWFHLSEADLAEMVMVNRSLEDHLRKVIETEDGQLMIDTFKDIVRRSFGVREGGDFYRDPKACAKFMGSPAYSQFFMKLAQDANFASNFINGVVPKDLAKHMAASKNNQNEREFTIDELLDMDETQFNEIAGTDIRKMSTLHMQAAFARRSRAAA